QAAESAAVRFRQSHGLDVAVARLGVVFGPWEHDTEVRDTLSLPFLLNRMAQAGETARLGRGTPDDWIHAGEAAEAVTRLLEATSLRDQTGFVAAHDEASACASYQAWRARMRAGFGDAAAIF
ncbi:NAD-dependent epimerase/dehydratase family protein, partial [Burkholderia gladioli]|uniref:NAD-dependent epimerase/dehydratase family protein n=1 Tax=Burkholderia gladioli TaxID=28095 RepID=UPI00163F517F